MFFISTIQLHTSEVSTYVHMNVICMKELWWFLATLGESHISEIYDIKALEKLLFDTYIPIQRRWIHAQEYKKENVISKM